MNCVSLLWLLQLECLFLIHNEVFASNFTEVTSNQSYCVGEAADFVWKYDPPETPIEEIYLLKNGEVFLKYYPEQGRWENVKSPAYRTSIQATLGEFHVIIQSLQVYDSGRYTILLSGPGSEHSHFINVYHKYDLIPTIKVNNNEQPVNKSVTLEKNLPNFQVSITTAKHLLANISILWNNKKKKKCNQAESCDYARDMIKSGNTTKSENNITIELDYGVCGIVIFNLTIDVVEEKLPSDPVHYTITGVPPDGDSEDENEASTARIVVPIACTVFLVIISIAVIIIIIVILVLKREKKSCFRPQNSVTKSKETDSSRPQDSEPEKGQNTVNEQGQQLLNKTGEAADAQPDDLEEKSNETEFFDIHTAPRQLTPVDSEEHMADNQPATLVNDDPEEQSNETGFCDHHTAPVTPRQLTPVDSEEHMADNQPATLVTVHTW